MTISDAKITQFEVWDNLRKNYLNDRFYIGQDGKLYIMEDNFLHEADTDRYETDITANGDEL